MGKLEVETLQESRLLFFVTLYWGVTMNVETLFSIVRNIINVPMVTIFRIAPCHCLCIYHILFEASVYCRPMAAAAPFQNSSKSANIYKPVTRSNQEYFFMKSLFFPVHFLPYRTRICCWMFGLDKFSRELKNTFCQDCKRNQLAKHRRCTSWVVSFKSKKFGPINQIANSLTQSEM